MMGPAISLTPYACLLVILHVVVLIMFVGFSSKTPIRYQLLLLSTAIMTVSGRTTSIRATLVSRIFTVRLTP